MHSPIPDYLQSVWDTCAQNVDGAVADYIPELADVDPDLFGICVATADGYLYEVGDTRTDFSIQSMSKPFTYALALAHRGIEEVGTKIDVEPSGDAFNNISLERATGRPSNAMINAGAITATSLIKDDGAESRFERIRAAYSKYAGRELAINNDIYESESQTGFRNRAIGYMLRTVGILEDDPDPVLEDYFRQCSISLDCRDVAIMAATLANGGVNPRTGDRLLSQPLLTHLLSVMTTCGMYDAAGDWVTSVGMPAKSGVSGGIMAVLPGQLGLAVYSPRLDQHGNSVRGVQACERLSRDLGMHFMRVSRESSSAIRATYTLSQAHQKSRVVSESRHDETLAARGNGVRVYELQGDLLFTGTETFLRDVGSLEIEPGTLVIDVQRVNEVNEVARRLILELVRRLNADGRHAVLVDSEGVFFEGADPTEFAEVFDDRRKALRWCASALVEP
ncbi:L-glutaminase [Antricoccus suffuscus]|uniref:Glutaminase n=1 Tax=Antricoccus suffuscus TaxID=1629062 RepID=A0A2T0ZWP0_9ACTN|nr:glutaminase A [Antricoccus suffuscus]PRZ40498.1 L-glutaminase [Antricoccus suffuscus]